MHYLKMNPKLRVLGIFCIIIFVYIIGIFQTVYGDERNESPFYYEFIDIPDNTIGIGDHWIKKINWSFIEDNVVYSLTKNGVLRNDLLNVNFSYVFDNRKYSYDFISDGNAYYEFKMIFDSIADSSYINDSCHTVFFNYSDGQLVYNFTDIWSIVGQFYSSFDLTNNVFTMILGRQCNKNVHIILDPNFGYEIAGSSSANIADAVSGSDYVLTEDGCVYNITAYLKFTKSFGDYEDYAQAYVFDTSYNVVGITECKLLSYSSSTSEWVTFEFDTPEFLSSGTYILGVACEDNSGWSCAVGRDDGTRTRYYGAYEFVCDSPENPMTPTTTSSQNVSIYATYVAGTCYGESCTDNCTISDLELNDLNFANKTTNVEDCEDYFNFTIDITDCIGDIDYINISLEDNGYTNHTNKGNGTYWHNVSDFLDCNRNYTLWINTSCQNGAVKLNYYYWFVTESCCVASVEAVKWDGLVVNTTQNCKDYNVSYINMSAYVNSTCDNTIEYVNFSIASGNYSVWTNEAEGLYWVNWTGIPLTCEQNISIYINVSDGDNCNDDVLNLTYWLNTCDCTDEVCEILYDDEDIINQSTCVNWSDDGYYNFTIDVNETMGNFSNGWINITVINISRNVSLSANGTYYLNYTYDITCGLNITWYVNSSTDCGENYSWYWFTTCSCGGVECSDCWNNSDFITEYNLRFNSSIDYWENNGSMEIDPANGLVILVIWIGSLVLLFKSRNYVLSSILVMFFLMLGVFEYIVITGYIGFTSWIIILVLGVAFGLYRVFDMKGEKHNV